MHTSASGTSCARNEWFTVPATCKQVSNSQPALLRKLTRQLKSSCQKIELPYDSWEWWACTTCVTSKFAFKTWMCNSISVLLNLSLADWCSTNLISRLGALKANVYPVHTLWPVGRRSSTVHHKTFNTNFFLLETTFSNLYLPLTHYIFICIRTLVP